jgi:Outer membrane protein beta-barrel domain
MKRLIWIVPMMMLACMLACTVTQAQTLAARSGNGTDVPSWEFAGGYSYLQSNINGSSFGLSGGGGSATENVNGWFGGRLEVNAYHGTESGITVSAQTYTFGPVFSYRKFNRIVPFGTVEFGAIRGTQGYLGISASVFRFAMTAGGGVDFTLNRHAAIRVQANYLLTNFLALRQDNIQGSAGLVFRFGSK